MRRRVAVIVVVLMVAGLMFVSLALANHGGGYHLDWWTADGGGAMNVTSDDGRYKLSGTIGQPDAGTLESSGGNYTLHGGFWAGDDYTAFIPIVIK